MSEPLLQGNWATLMLPIRDDDSIDMGRLADEIDTLIGFGVDGIYSNGTAGEFYNQTETEFDLIHDLLASKCQAAGMPFQVGVSHMSPLLSFERLKRSLKWDPVAVQVILPDWFPTAEAEQIAFLQKMAAVSERVRLVLYNPHHAKVRLTPAQFGRLKDAVPQLVGVKVPGGDAGWYDQMRQNMVGLSVFVPGHFLATGIREGAHGAYSNVACLHPKIAQDWYNLMQRDLEKALEWESRIQQFMSECIAPYITQHHYPNQACDKLLAAVGGWADLGTRLRWPYRFIPKTEVEPVQDVGRRLLPEFFDNRLSWQPKS